MLEPCSSNVQRRLPDIRPCAASSRGHTYPSSTSAENRRAKPISSCNGGAKHRPCVEEVDELASNRRALFDSTAVRATPVRSTRKVVVYRIESPNVSAVEDVESEWEEEDEEFSILEKDELLQSPSKVFVPKSIPSSSTAHVATRHLANFVDLTISSDGDGCAEREKAGRDTGMASRPETTTTSEDDDNLSPAILRLCVPLSICIYDQQLIVLSSSPPRLKSPSKRPPLSPRRPATPPPPPPASPNESRLTSPKKDNRVRADIPSAPRFRPSLESSWSPTAHINWADTHHSPPKLLASPRRPQAVSVPHSHLKRGSGSPTAACHATATRKAFDATKHALAASFLADLDETLNAGAVSALAANTGGITLTWSSKLLSTAGRAHWRREAVRTGGGGIPTLTYRHIASIELATKVITSPARLLNVLAHEYCHLANFMLSGVRNAPHGASFQAWAARATAAFAHRGVEVTTKHDYDIAYRYAWVCGGATAVAAATAAAAAIEPGGGRGGGHDVPDNPAGCGAKYERHSKSIDPIRHACSKCRGTLVQVRPVPRRAGGGAGGSTGAGEAGRTTTAMTMASSYAMFVKQEFAGTRANMAPGSPVKDVMREVGRRYREHKGERERERERERGQGLGIENDEQGVRRGDEGDCITDSQQQVARGRGELREGDGGVSELDVQADELDAREEVGVDGVARVLDFLTLASR